MKSRTKKKILPWIFIAPTFFFLGMFTYYPALRSLFLSFMRMNMATPEPVFTGLENFKRAFSTPLFWRVAGNNLFYAFVTVPITMASALFLALLVNQKIFGSSFFKTTYFYPNVIPMAAASMIWLYIFLPGYGFLNYILGKIGIPNIEWVGDSKFAIWALIIVAIWKNAGYYMVIFLGGLQQLPTEIYEVATIDGASAWRKFWKITWPLLSPTTFFAFIIAVINSFQAVDQIYLMTRGGPANSTNMFVYYIYQVAFKYWDFGYASALTVILLVLLLVFTVLAFFFMERRVFYESGERL